MPGARKNQIARDPELARLGTLYKVAKTSYSGLSAHAFQPLTVFLSLSLSLSLSLCLLFISSPVSHRLAIVNCLRLLYSIPIVFQILYRLGSLPIILLLG